MDFEQRQAGKHRILDGVEKVEYLDYNYRHIDKEDWSKIRDRIDIDLKWILDPLGYKKDVCYCSSL